MKIPRSAIARVVEAVLETEARKATLYLAPDTVVKASRRGARLGYRMCNGARVIRRAEVVLTLGQPNYDERAFIRACKAAGEPFPVRKVQLKFYPRKRKR